MVSNSNSTSNNSKSRSIEDINEKIASGKATILTAHEFKNLVKEGSPPKLEEVDVVTCGTCGVMSGTTALFNLTVSEAGIFKKAKKLYLNGVPAFTGPCPNEWLGSVDAFVYGTSHSKNDSEYGGGFLFKDLLEGKEISIELESIDGDIIESTTTLDEMGKAHLIGTRMAFKNYTAFTNPGKSSVSSIFNAIPL
ncbi:MAG: homocysteine biosynthesis protein, partial [Methanobacteriaceae archaeon]